MSAVTRADRLIVAGLLAVFLGLAGLAVAQRSDALRPRKSSAAAAATTNAAPTVPAVPAPASLPPPAAAAAGPQPVGQATPSPATPSSATPPPATATAPSSGPVQRVPGPYLAVGDSLMLDIQTDLEADLPGIQVDGSVSRQFEAGIAVVDAARAAGTLGNVLIVELGTNGTVTPADVDAMMQAAAGVRRVVFVNVDVPRAWEATDNSVLAAGVARYPGVAVLADWYALSSPHPEWFTPDQVHLEPAGAQAMAALIAADA